MPPPFGNEERVTGVELDVVKRSPIEPRERSRRKRSERNIARFGGVGEFGVFCGGGGVRVHRGRRCRVLVHCVFVVVVVVIVFVCVRI